MRARIRRLAASVAVGAAALVVVMGGGAPQQTDAAFTDAEHSASSQLGTIVLQPPQMVQVTTCNRPGLTNLTRPFLVVQWRWPSTARPYPDLAPSDLSWQIDGEASPDPATTGPNASGVYASTFRHGLLDNILDSIGNLLGAEFPIGAQTTWTSSAGTVWTSAGESGVVMDVPLLIGSPDCTIY